MKDFFHSISLLSDRKHAEMSRNLDKDLKFEKKNIQLVGMEQDEYDKEKRGPGIRFLHSFNIALLGKHVWNFLNNPGSLVARVFKTRYYNNYHLMHANKGGSSSYIWFGK